MFRLHYEATQARVEEALREQIGRLGRYADLREAMEYSLMAGGKRIRPVLVLESCRMCGGDPETALPFACAVEMIHTYSLIHDDLPAMDDDELRRGRPTNHMVYGEATAILAGDGLLTAAFQTLTQADLTAQQVMEAVACRSLAAGPEGSLTRAELEQLQSLKTGALIAAAAELGCIAAGGSPEQREAVRRYAQCLGRAFQVQDDILDVTSTDEELGKPTGSDREKEKNTFVSLLGLERSRELVEELTAQAVAALDGFASRDFLVWLANTLAQRTK